MPTLGGSIGQILEKNELKLVRSFRRFYSLFCYDVARIGHREVLFTVL